MRLLIRPGFFKTPYLRSRKRYAIAFAILVAVLSGKNWGANHASAQVAPARTAPPIFRVEDIGRLGQPHLTSRQLNWISRIRRTPYFKHRLSTLRYVMIDLSGHQWPGPPLVVFVENGPGSGQGVVIVDHSSIACNMSYFNYEIAPGTPGCQPLLPSPVQ
jgi:hypothetical protein